MLWPKYILTNEQLTLKAVKIRYYSTYEAFLYFFAQLSD